MINLYGLDAVLMKNCFLTSCMSDDKVSSDSPIDATTAAQLVFVLDLYTLGIRSCIRSVFVLLFAMGVPMQSRYY